MNIVLFQFCQIALKFENYLILQQYWIVQTHTILLQVILNIPYAVFTDIHRRFVILAVVVGLSIQEVSQPDSSLAEGPEIVEAGGKIIGVNLHDGIKGSLGNG